MITRVSTAEEITLVAGGAAHLLQASLADVQNMTDVSTSVPQSTHHSTQWNSVTEIIGCSTAPFALQMDFHWQTIVSCAAPTTWNSLPASVINCDTLCI